MSTKLTKLQKNRGVAGVKQRSRIGLATLLRQRMPEEIVCDWYMTILMGRWPVLVKDERCTSTAGLRVEVHPQMRPTEEQMYRAMKDMNDRQFGMPAQKLHVEQEVQAALSVTVTHDLPNVKVLTAESKELMYKALGIQQKLLPATPGDKFDDMDVTDADFEMIPVNKGTGSDDK